YLAIAFAVMKLQKGVIERIILCRPAVEAGENLGFLPGDMKEKIDPYLRPLYDALHDMLTPEQIVHHLSQQAIEIAPLAFMRGRTLSKACVVLDEAQNTTTAQMKMVLTRLGPDSHMIVTGDPSQSDLPFKTTSGLTEAMHVLRDVEDIKFIQFTEDDVVRDPLVAKIVKAYERFDKERHAAQNKSNGKDKP
ncbi:MAG: PhoH family protein, partial [Alphaproteobacteria bacterium]